MNNLNDKNGFDNIQPTYEIATETPTTETERPLPIGQAVTAMIFGIISIILGELFGIPGIIFSIIGKAKSNALLAEYPDTRVAGFAKAGRITSTIGLITSIFWLFFWIFYIVAIVMAATQGMA